MWIWTCTIEGRIFRLGLLCPKTHLRLGWDITAAAAYKGIENAQKEGYLPDHAVQ